jgi:opacity protein-like surface antigen
MKKMYGAAAAVAVVMVATSGQAQDGGMGFSINPYIEGGIGASRTSYESGGFNTVGPFFNVPETEVDTGVSVKMAIGLSDIVSFGPVGLRIEGEVNTFDGASFITGSFPGAPNPTFFYATQVDRSYTAMANVWADFSPLESMPITLSVGGGVGAAWLSGSTNDTVVTAAASDTTFSWNVGAQAAYAFDENFTAGVEARYYDLGTLDMPINGGPGGNYTLDFSSLYAGAFLRLNFGDIGG